jgi:hypothetical protein
MAGGKRRLHDSAHPTTAPQSRVEAEAVAGAAGAVAGQTGQGPETLRSPEPEHADSEPRTEEHSTRRGDV